MNDKKKSVLYVALLFLRGYGVIDFIETQNELSADDAFVELSKDSTLDRFGEGIYEVSLMREWWDDEKRRLIKAECLKKVVIEWEVE